jgi:hypothetical protein
MSPSCNRVMSNLDLFLYETELHQTLRKRPSKRLMPECKRSLKVRFWCPKTLIYLTGSSAINVLRMVKCVFQAIVWLPLSVCQDVRMGKRDEYKDCRQAGRGVEKIVDSEIARHDQWHAQVSCLECLCAKSYLLCFSYAIPMVVMLVTFGLFFTFWSRWHI